MLDLRACAWRLVCRTGHKLDPVLREPLVTRVTWAVLQPGNRQGNERCSELLTSEGTTPDHLRECLISWEPTVSRREASGRRRWLRPIAWFGVGSPRGGLERDGMPIQRKFSRVGPLAGVLPQPLLPGQQMYG